MLYVQDRNREAHSTATLFEDFLGLFPTSSVTSLKVIEHSSLVMSQIFSITIRDRNGRHLHRSKR